MKALVFSTAFVLTLSSQAPIAGDVPVAVEIQRRLS